MQIISRRGGEQALSTCPAHPTSNRRACKAILGIALPALMLAVPGVTLTSLAPSQGAGTSGSAPRARAQSGSVGTSPATTIDWARGTVFGSVGNAGADAVADCAVAAVADIEQILQGRTTPIDPAPFLAAYAALARSAGESPGPSATIPPWLVLRAWHAPGIAGTRIAPALPVAPGRARLEQALAGGPLYAVVDLPRPVSAAPVWVGTDDVAIRSWTTTSAPSGYLGSGVHVVAVVGYDARYVEVVTWGYVQPISWSLWARLATQVWAITPQAGP